jgi:hypothetical protein
MREADGHRGIRDPFLPPSQQPHGDARPRSAIKSTAAKAPATGAAADNRAAEPAGGADARSPTATGSLVVVDIGIMAVNQITVEGRNWIEQSERVLLLGTDPVTERWIHTLNKHVESLSNLQTADEIVERTLEHVRAGLSVCLAYRGFLALSLEVSRQATERSRAEGFSAAIVPGVSTLDCLSVDLGLDLLGTGCQCFTADGFVERSRQPDVMAALILSLAEDTALADLRDLLRRWYGAEHEIILYEPARYSVLDPTIERCEIGKLAEASLAGISTLVVPPKVETAAGLPDD